MKTWTVKFRVSAKKIIADLYYGDARVKRWSIDNNPSNLTFIPQEFRDTCKITAAFLNENNFDPETNKEYLARMLKDHKPPIELEFPFVVDLKKRE